MSILRIFINEYMNIYEISNDIIIIEWQEKEGVFLSIFIVRHAFNWRAFRGWIPQHTILKIYDKYYDDSFCWMRMYQHMEFYELFKSVVVHRVVSGHGCKRRSWERLVQEKLTKMGGGLRGHANYVVVQRDHTKWVVYM